MPTLIAHARELRELAQRRERDPSQIVHELGAHTTELFARAAHREGSVVPVVIPAHNEQGDIPATLLAIARAGGLAVVVSNNSTDRTVEYAEAMGAHVLVQDDGRKMAATKAGLAYATGELDAQRVLFTDADTSTPTTWVDAMEHALLEHESDSGVMVCGESLVWHGKPAVDLAMNGGNLIRVAARVLSGNGSPPARGHNYGVSIDDEGRIEGAFMSLPSELFVQPGAAGDDTQIAQAVRDAGSTVVGVLDPATWVLTRGGRLTTLSQVIAVGLGRVSFQEAAAGSYQLEYLSPAEGTELSMPSEQL